MYSAKRISQSVALLLSLGVPLGCDADDGREGSLDDRQLAVCNESYEAEDSTESKGWSEDSLHIENGSYMDAGGIGSSISWDIGDVPPGRYELSVYYANGGSNPRPVITSVNDRTQEGNMAFSSTKGWSRWDWESQDISVDEWGSKLTLEVKEERGGPNIDYIELSDKDTCG